MADTSLIFNVIARDSGLGRVLDRIGSGFRGAGRDAEEALEKASQGTENLDRQIQEAEERVRSLAQEFERTGDKTLFSKISRDRSLISQLNKVRDELRRTGDDAASGGQDVDRMGSIFSRAAGMAGGLGGALSSAGAGAASMLSSVAGLVAVGMGLGVFASVGAPALYAFGGAAAAIPAMLSGAIAAIAVLKMGMGGLGENWKAMNAPPTGGGGGGGGAPAIDMTPKIRAVEAAQRDVTRTSRDMKDAQEELREAQLAVASAQEVARERISDLNREYRQAKADQAEATTGLVEAEQQLRLAQGRGNPEEIRRAELALEKQRLAVEEAADKTDDLGKESAEAARKGVNGSDEVVAARKREADAQRRVQDAAEAHRLAIQRLGDAQADLKRKIDSAAASGGGFGGVTLPRIARSAQDFLDELKRLKPAFDDLRLDIQQRLFEGLAGKLRILAERWLPALHRQLGGMADVINGVVKTAFDSLSDPEFISNMEVGLSHSSGMIGKIGQAIAGPLVDAWGRLTRAAAPILDVIGEKVAGIIERFSEWIAKADESGALDEFMQNAADILGDVFDVLEDIGRIAGSVISILFGTETGAGGWDALVETLDDIANWLADPAHQAQVAEFIDGFFAVGVGLWNLFGIIMRIPDYVRAAGDWFGQMWRNINTWLSNLPRSAQTWFSSMMRTAAAWVSSGVNSVVSYFRGLGGRVAGAIRNLPSVFGNIGTYLRNAVSGLYGWMLGVGQNIVAGIWNGIASRANWLWNQASNFAAGIWRGVTSALGISSPSRVMADKVGRWIPEGIAMGMMGNRRSVMRAVDAISADLARASLAVPTVGMEGALAAASGTLTVAARRQRIEVVSRLDVTGQEGALKKLIRGMARTENLYQNKG